jgi:uncharacterized protein (DUF2141 family)
MKNVEKHINEIVSKVLSEQVALKAEEIMSMANEELHGGQKKLDKNKNGKLDKNYLGIPTEAYGFSNNARRTFSAPSFEEAEVNLNSDLAISITLK